MPLHRQRAEHYRQQFSQMSAPADVLLLCSRIVHDHQTQLRVVVDEYERAAVDLAQLARENENLRREIGLMRRAAATAKNFMGRGRLADVTRLINGLALPSATGES
jgi:hypothetical protein